MGTDAKIDDAVRRACEEPTLLDALTWISVWESERVVREAHAFLSGKVGANPDGTGWSTCFRECIKGVTEKYPLARERGRNHCPIGHTMEKPCAKQYGPPSGCRGCNTNLLTFVPDKYVPAQDC